jgi:putative transcriptional regulator
MNINNSLLLREFMKMLVSQIGEIRRSKGLLQKFVAEQVGIKQQQLSDWENDKFPRYDKAYKLAKVLGVGIEDLYKEVEEKEIKNPTLHE